jgi:hypothetical protein
MANGISPIRRQVSSPYLSLSEFKNAPTALDYGNIVAGQNQSAQDAELTNAITRASSWIDQYCNQIIGATADSEQQRTRIKPDGTIRFHPKYFPVVALTSFSWGMTPNSLTTAPDCSVAWFEEQEIIFPYAGNNLTYSSQGPLSFGFPMSSRQEVFIKYDYVNGYANTLTSASASAGATSIVVSNPTGIVPNETLKIFDGASTENVTISSSYTFGSSTVQLASPLLFDHASGVSVSALPAAVKEACILVTSAYLKIRGDASLVMAVTTNPGQQIEGSQQVGSDIAHAMDLLKPFRRIR